MVVPTIDDRERYIDGLAASDAGNGDEFTLYLCELVKESLEAIREARVKTLDDQELDVDVSLEDDDPLSKVMGRLINQDRLPAKRVYEPWKATFELLKAEMVLVINQFNQKYSADGYETKVISYDILTEEKFSRLFLGLPTTKTWFFGLEFRAPLRKERFMFYFQSKFDSKKGIDERGVVLRIGRYDGDEYRSLAPAVFQPCEIGWKDGSVQLNWPDEQPKTKPLRFQVALLLAEIIKAFFEQPSEVRAAGH